MKIIVKKGLDIPLMGKPEGSPRSLPPPQQVSLSLSPFEHIRFKVLVKVGEKVKIGQPLVENKAVPGQMFVSPGGGVVAEIRRGHKRQLLDVIINVDSREEYFEHPSLNPETATLEQCLDLFMRGGLFPHVHLRPFDLIPQPQHRPRDIFVTALETRPFEPSIEMQVAGNALYFQAGLKVLQKLTTGKVHLVYSDKTTCEPFLQAEQVEKHTAQGPHPAGSSSVHIHRIAPIRRPDDYVWSLTALDVVIIGRMALEGRYHTSRVLSIAGNGVIEEKRGFFQGRIGYAIKELMADRIGGRDLALIAGDPLTGRMVEGDDFLGFDDTCFSVLPINAAREAFHFLRLGLHKYSATRAYATGHLKPPIDGFPFTTNQHGEERAFIDPAVYDKVMPMRIPVAFLVKAILAQDFELADQLGLLEITPQDFALPTFICPSKIEMVEIVKEGLHRYAQEMGH